MRTLNIKGYKKNYTIDIPTHSSEVYFLDFLKCLESNNIVDVCMSYEDIKNDRGSAQVVAAVASQLGWLQREIANNKVKEKHPDNYVLIAGELYEVPDNIRMIPAGAYFDCVEYMKDDENALKNFHKLVGTVLHGYNSPKFDPRECDRLINNTGQHNYLEVLQLGNFFLTQLTNSKKTNRLLLRKVKKAIWKKWRVIVLYLRLLLPFR